MTSDKYKFGTYVKGIELNKNHTAPREVRGWIDNDFTDKEGCCIAIDSPSRGNAWLIPSTVCEVNRVLDWESAMHRDLPLNTELKHFKGGRYKIIAIADHVDYGRCVVYEDITDTGHVWVRDYAEFMSKVDRLKYPHATQEYRFELV